MERSPIPPKNNDAKRPVQKPSIGLRALVREELRGLPRNTFALAAVATILGIFAPMGMGLYSGEGGVDKIMMFVWLIAELVVAIIVAARVAGVRRNRFV